jgi:hypothetical protein
MPGVFSCLHIETSKHMRDNTIDDEYEAHIQASVDAFLPLTGDQIARLSALFDYTPGGDGR